jgi:hypothetical protein
MYSTGVLRGGDLASTCVHQGSSDLCILSSHVICLCVWIVVVQAVVYIQCLLGVSRNEVPSTAGPRPRQGELTKRDAWG